MKTSSTVLVGVDTGGTFTDLVLAAEGQLFTHKVASTPSDFAEGVVEGIQAALARAKLDPLVRSRTSRSKGKARKRGRQTRKFGFTLVHSSTVATNALLERKGAKTALITTEGFGDVLEIGRQARRQIYNLKAERPPPLVPRSLRKEVAERVSAEGEIIRKLDERKLGALLETLSRQRVESIAVCLLFSFLKDTHEATIARAARRRGFSVSASSEIAPEFREYERMNTTVANAYVAPTVSRYLRTLHKWVTPLGAQHIRVVQSNGGSLSTKAAGAEAVHTLLSGPAAGVIGAISLARTAHHGKHAAAKLKLITFDMGGTSTDVSLVDDRYRIHTEGEVGELPIRVPMIDIHTVGAGGGSLAHFDSGGALRVGPESAGADPGPACYGRGDGATVTDANLVSQRLAPDRFLGGRMRLDAGRAHSALQRIARRLDTGVKEAAQAVLRIVNSNMERAIREISVQRGHDPREFTLVCFGGAGGLHACALADALRIPRVLIPRNPGVLSAWGALVGDVVRDYARTVMLPFAKDATASLAGVFRELSRRGGEELQEEGFDNRTITLTRSLDVRYTGQAYELNVPFSGDLEAAAKAFHEAHRKRYGHSTPEAPIEIVTARVRALAVPEKPALQELAWRPGRARATQPRKRKGLRLYERAELQHRSQVQGEALVLEEYATTYLPRHWKGVVDRWGHLTLSSS